MDELFFRSIEEKHRILVAHIDKIFKVIVGNDEEQKSQHIAAGWNAANNLANIFATQDQPIWLRQLLDVLSRPRNGFSLNQLLLQLISLNEHLRSHNWRGSEDSRLGFDFEAIYEKHKAQSQLPSLFDQVASSLQALIESGEIDSRKVAKTIESLISTIQKNRNSSYFSVQGTRHFLANVLKNFLLEELKKIPALGSLITAVEKSVAELDSGIQEMQLNIAEELKRTHSADFPFLTYDRTGSLLSSSGNTTLDADA